MTQGLSRTAALERARRRVSIYRLSRGHWQITYRLGRSSGAWVQGRSGDWDVIAREASATVASEALQMMRPTMDPMDADRMIRDAQVDVFPGYAAADLLRVALRNLNP